MQEPIATETEQTITAPVDTYDYSAKLLSVKAKAFYVLDISTGKVLFARNENERLPLASITKLMTGFVTLDLIPQNTVISITAEDLRQMGDSGLILSERWQRDDLLQFTLISSSNDGAHALRRTADTYIAASNTDTIALMNQKAAALGLLDTLFVNETGLDARYDTAGAYASARDTAYLLSAILKNNPTLFALTNTPTVRFLSLDRVSHTAYNTNKAISALSGLIGSKTGFTDLAGGNLAIIFDAGFAHPIAVVVLGSTQSDRFTDVEMLAHLARIKLSGGEFGD